MKHFEYNAKHLTAFKKFSLKTFHEYIKFHTLYAHYKTFLYLSIPVIPNLIIFCIEDQISL